MTRFLILLFSATLFLYGCGDDTTNMGGAGGTGGPGGAGGQSGTGGGSATVWPCTEQGIRDAIGAGGGPHTFLCDRPTVVTTESTIEVEGEAILDGGNNLTVSGGESHRIFFLQRRSRLDLRNMTLTLGSAEGSGGAIVNDGGDLLLENCIVTENQASVSAGAISSSQGFLQIVASVITRNEAPEVGGISCTGTMLVDSSDITENVGAGISCGADARILDSVVSDNQGGGVWTGGTMLISGSAITNNRSEIPGGGINNSGSLTLENSMVSDNEGARGGGLFNAGSLSMDSTTVIGNTAVWGGGVYSSDAPGFGAGQALGVAEVAVMSIGNSTISGNTAERGGGIYSGALRLASWNTTISGNVANEAGGGAYLRGTMLGASTTFFNANTIVENAAPSASAVQVEGETATLRLAGSIIEGDCNSSDVSALRSEGSNIESPGDSCELSAPSDLANVTSEQLNLGPLQNNGGPTQTHLPMPDSVAIDSVPLEDCGVVLLIEPLVDQRSVERPQGPGCDAGSVEVGP